MTTQESSLPTNDTNTTAALIQLMIGLNPGLKIDNSNIAMMLCKLQSTMGVFNQNQKRDDEDDHGPGGNKFVSSNSNVADNNDGSNNNNNNSNNNSNDNNNSNNNHNSNNNSNDNNNNNNNNNCNNNQIEQTCNCKVFDVSIDEFIEVYGMELVCVCKNIEELKKTRDDLLNKGYKVFSKVFWDIVAGRDGVHRFMMFDKPCHRVNELLLGIQQILEKDLIDVQSLNLTTRMTTSRMTSLFWLQITLSALSMILRSNKLSWTKESVENIYKMIENIYVVWL